MQWKINLTQMICLRIGKTTEAKPPSGEFKVTTPENPVLSKQAVINKRNPNTKYQPTIEPLSQYTIGLVI